MNWSKLKSDIKQIAIPIIAISLYILLGNLIMSKRCPMRMLFGIPCPGCGTTRAFLFLIQGKFSEAAISNPLWIYIVVSGTIFLFNRYFVTSTSVSESITKILKIFIVVAVTLCIVYYIYRMIYWFPDKAPMVYDPENLLERLGILGK